MSAFVTANRSIPGSKDLKWIVCVDCATVQASLTLSWTEVLLGSQFILFFKETLKSDTLKLICCIFYFTEFYFHLPLFCSHFSVLRVPLFQTEYQVSTALCSKSLCFDEKPLLYFGYQKGHSAVVSTI